MHCNKTFSAYEIQNTILNEQKMAHFIFVFVQLVHCTLAQLHHTTCPLFLFDIVHRLVHSTIRVLDKNMRYQSGSKITGHADHARQQRKL